MYTETLFSGMEQAVGLLQEQEPALLRAAAVLSEAADAGRLVHVFGTDARAADITGELFFRAGGLACIDPIYDPALANSHGAYRSELCRAMDGLAPCILDYYEFIEPGDPMLLVGFDPDGPAFSQAARWARDKGLFLIMATPQPPADTDTAALAQIMLLAGGQYATVCMTALLHALGDAAARHVRADLLWPGTFFPDTIGAKQIIDAYLWRVRHL